MRGAAKIIIQSQDGQLGGAGRSRDDLELSETVTLTNENNQGVTSWRWTFLDRPAGSAAAFSNPTAASCTFVPDVVGSYFVQLQVNQGSSGQLAKSLCVVRDQDDRRYLAYGETTEANWNIDGEPNTRGWLPDLEAWFQPPSDPISNRLAISVQDEEFGAVGDGIADDTAAIQAAIDYVDDLGGGRIYFPPGTYRTTATLTFGNDQEFIGSATQSSVISYTGASWAFQQVTPGTRIYNVRFTTLQVSVTAAAAGGLDLTDVSLAHLDGVAVFGGDFELGIGIRFRATTSGHCVYNTAHASRCLSIGTGFHIEGAASGGGSNEHHLLDCRTTNCRYGIQIIDGNHNVIQNCSIETGHSVGVLVSATTSALSDGNTITGCRFEGVPINISVSGTAANVRFLCAHHNHHVTGTAYGGSVLSTTQPNIGQDSGTAQNQLYVVSALATGPSFFWACSTAATQVMTLRNSNTGSGSPTLLTLSGGRTASHAWSVAGWNGSADTENAFCTVGGALSVASVDSVGSIAITGAGNITVPNGNVSLTGSGGLAIFGDGSSAGNVGLEIRKADANSNTYLGFRIGTLAAGARWAEQWDSSENRVGLMYDAAGSLHALRPYRFNYNATTGRGGFAACRLWGDLGTTLVNGDFTLSGGWGNTATAVVAANSKSMRGTVTVTVQGTGLGTGPTITLTFPEGTWTTAPHAIVVRNGGTGVTLTDVTYTLTATTLVIRGEGPAPLVGETYTYAWMLMG